MHFKFFLFFFLASSFDVSSPATLRTFSHFLYTDWLSRSPFLSEKRSVWLGSWTKYGNMNMNTITGKQMDESDQRDSCIILIQGKYDRNEGSSFFYVWDSCHSNFFITRSHFFPRSQGCDALMYRSPRIRFSSYVRQNHIFSDIIEQDMSFSDGETTYNPCEV